MRIANQRHTSMAEPRTVCSLASTLMHNGSRTRMKPLVVSKLGPLALVVAIGVGCGGQTAGTSVGSGGASGRGGDRDAGSDSVGTNPTDARSDATSSGGSRGGTGGSAAGGTAGGGAGGAGNRGGTGGKGGGAGAGGGASSGRCTTFQFQPSHPCQDQIVVDMNGDGRLDVVSGWSDSTGLHVMVYRQTAARVFADPDQYDYGTSLYYLERMAAADLDQDGIPDIAIPDAYGRVALMLSGSGTGYSFAPLLVSSKQEDLYDVALADFDGDGYRDIVVPVYDTSASIGLYWGTGRGAFAIRADQKLCSLGTRTTVVDANEDGHPDLVVACMGGGGQILINQGDDRSRQSYSRVAPRATTPRRAISTRTGTWTW